MSQAPMQQWICIICGFVYDEAEGLPQHGIAPGTRFETFPEDWTCPECGSPKGSFEVMTE
jgi:rubredoxin